MDRLATGILIAVFALAIGAGTVRETVAAETGAKATDLAPSSTSQIPVVHGPRSERVMSLILTLEALRAAPAVLSAK